MYFYYEFRCKLLKMGNILLLNMFLVYIYVRLRLEFRIFFMKKILYFLLYFLDFGKNYLLIIKS